MTKIPDSHTDCPSTLRTTTSGKLLRAAALASVLVPLGSVAADAALINIQCDANGGGCTGGEFGSGGGFYEPEGSGVNTWGFYDGDILLYTFQITGEAINDFELFVSDSQFDSQSVEPPYNIPFPDSACIPLLEGDDSQTTEDDLCVIFDVFTSDEVNWVDGYYVEMRWFAPLEPGQFATRPPDDGRNFIFRAADGFNFDDPLVDDNLYLPFATPDDPALGGRGSNFSSFIAGRATIPEPSTLLLLGTGLATALYRRRKIG